MKVTIDIPKNATIKEILEAVIKATDYEGLRGEHCGCKGDELCECCGNDGLIDPGCQLGYVEDCDACKNHCGRPVSAYCMTLKRSKK